MKHYRSSLPRAALGLIAVAMSAITLGVLVVLPAWEESASYDWQASVPAPIARAAQQMGSDGRPGRANAALPTSHSS